MLEKSTNTSFNLPNFGKDLDEVLKLNSKVVSRSLINEFIASSFDDFISEKEIADAGTLADALTNVKTRLTNPNYYINSYETELTAIDKLIQIEKVAGSITVNDINKKKKEKMNLLNEKSNIILVAIFLVHIGFAYSFRESRYELIILALAFIYISSIVCFPN